MPETIDLRPPLDLLADWVRASDAHAAHRLPLLAEAQRIAAGDVEVPAQRRAELAAALERWRYQHLDERRGNLDAMGLRLAEVLDVAANRLAGRALRLPRCPRDAVLGTVPVRASATSRTKSLRAAAALDPQVPLAEMTQRAAELTAEQFIDAGGEETADAALCPALSVEPLREPLRVLRLPLSRTQSSGSTSASTRPCGRPRFSAAAASATCCWWPASFRG